MQRKFTLFVAIFGLALLITMATFFLTGASSQPVAQTLHPGSHSHLDHSAFFTQKFTSGSDVTKACLTCHENAATEMMKTEHWQWQGKAVAIPGHKGKHRIGKKNLLNNFCIGIDGNWPACTRCHAGYGWKDGNFDFQNEENIDCLVCHDGSGDYRKSKAGMPDKDVDLLAVAKSVGYPKRENCGLCHFYGGGGLGVKHGDLDNSLENAAVDTDVHMGREKFLCIDCHKTVDHDITGKAYSVSVNHDNGIGCTNCHIGSPHTDARIDTHLKSVACQTCHIPTYANQVPTKMDWDWSKAGDDSRPDNVHEYLKIKGEFIYEQSVKPEYGWFNMKVDRYLVGDKIDPSKVTVLNRPNGDINDPSAKIWPFKVHRGKQPYDKKYNYLVPPVTAGKGGYWWEFNWDKALQMGAELAKQPYSGEYGFAETAMYWPLSHMVRPKEHALGCEDCHSEGGRMDWNALGYTNDPIRTGGRK